MRATIRRACASSAALICSKSRVRRTSSAEKVSAASNSTFSGGAFPEGAGGCQASAIRRETMDAAGMRTCGSIWARAASTPNGSRQNSRNA